MITRLGKIVVFICFVFVSSSKNEELVDKQKLKSVDFPEDEIDKEKQKVVTVPEGKLRIGSFNAQIFGEKKRKNAEVMKTIASIVQRYDILFLQEVRDASGEAVKALLSLVNESADKKNTFSVLVGKRLGRSKSKEQYVWFYKKARVRPVHKELEVKDKSNVWERKPSLVFWQVKNPKMPSKKKSSHVFATLGIHVKPTDAIREIDKLARLVDSVVKTSIAGLGVLLMGDLNADCAYISKKKWNCIKSDTCTTTKMRLWNPKKYTWLLPEDVDTTTTFGRTCTYDRFVFSGGCDDCVKRFVDADAFNFGDSFNLHREHIKSVSDHWPIELLLDISPTIGTDKDKISEPPSLRFRNLTI